MSNQAGPSVRYPDSDTGVLVGDHVEFKVWLLFWRGWQPGRVYYVPGISPRNPTLELNGLSWVSVHGPDGGQTGFVVDPSSLRLKGSIRFVRRSDDRLTTTPPGYEFRED